MKTNNQTFMVEKIRTQYIPAEPSPVDELKALDKKVKKPANVFAWVFGTLAALIMGGGMSLIMTDLGTALGMANTEIIGIAIGVAGMAMALVNYPIYKAFLASRRKKYAPQIMAISDKLLQTSRPIS